MRQSVKKLLNTQSKICEADLSYPIILRNQGRIMDGMHWVCKAKLEGRKTILAVQFEQALEPDYVCKQPDELPY